MVFWSYICSAGPWDSSKSVQWNPHSHCSWNEKGGTKVVNLEGWGILLRDKNHRTADTQTLPFFFSCWLDYAQNFRVQYRSNFLMGRFFLPEQFVFVSLMTVIDFFPLGMKGCSKF